MLNRWILVLLALALPFMGAGVMGLEAAPSVDGGWDPDTASLAGFEGLPDLSRDSAKFMVITGDNNQSIGLEPLQVGITIPAAQASARIALFDADSTGLWDQRAGDAILLFAPRVQYEVFVDPDGSVLAALAALPPLPASTDPDTQLTAAELSKRVVKCFSNDPAFASSDNKWAALYDRATASAEVQSAKAPNGDYKFVFRATLLPNSPPVPDFPGAPGTGIQGTERVGFKLAYNGTYLLKAGDVLGFAGGSIDERYFIVASDTEQANTQDPLPGATIPGTALTNAYDGKFNFPFHHSWFCKGDIKLFEGDADWNANIPIATIDMNPTGVPPDNGGLYDITLPLACQPPGYVKPVFFKRDNSMFKVGTPIRWFVFPIPPGGHNGASPEMAGFPAPFFASGAPAGGKFGNSETAAANWPGHASVNAFCQQSLAPNNSASAAPFDYQSFNLTKSVVDTRPGLWCVRWDGVDASNFVFMKFDQDIGSTPRDSTISGRIFCDDNANGTFEVGVDSSLGVAINLSAQQVDPATGVALPGVPPIAITTDVTGAFGPVIAPAGRYIFTITTPHMLSPTPPVVLPLDVSFAQGSCELDIAIPLNCKQPISGRLFCDNNADCIYQPAPAGTDTLLPASFLPATVQLQQVDATGAPIGAPTTVQTDATGAYSFPGNAFGTYQISVVPQLTLPTNCPTTLTVTLGINTGPSTGNDFGYLCETMGCGFLWCDDNKNGVFDAGEPPLGLPDYTVEVRPTGQPAATPLVGTAVAGVPGRWCVMGLTPGVSYTATVKYKGTTTLPKNVMSINGLTQTFTALPPPTMTPDTNFTFMCTEEVCGYIYCDTNGNCIYEAGIDVLFSGPDWTVEITPDPQTVPATAAIVANVDPAKGNRWCATLPFGTWKLTVKYKGGTTFPWPYVLTTPVSGMQTVTVTADSTNGSQDYCFTCEAKGKVYCDENGSGTFDTGDLPLGGAPWLVTFTSPTNPTQTVVPDGLNMGAFAASLPAGSWTATITYAGGQSWPAPVSAPVTPTTVNFAVPQATAPSLDFIFKCLLTPKIDVFCDDNVNGTLDAGENRLVGPAWTVTISGGPAGFVPVTLPVGANGQVAVPALPLGTYTATVNYNGGTNWPLNPEIVAPLGPTSTQFTLAAGAPAPSVSFPFSCKTFPIMGTVFCDDNVNGQLDAGENRLVGPAWTVTVAGGPAGFVPVTVPVGADGSWSVPGLGGGNYTASVLYNATTTWPTTPEIVAALGPTTVPFTVSATGANPAAIPFPFSCTPITKIKGSVFCDDNVNGTKDAGENRLVGPAWTVTIAGGPAGFVPVVVPVAADGTFEASMLPLGSYTATVLYNGGTSWPTNPEIVAPLGPTTQPFTLTRAAPVGPDLAFPFSCKTGRIKGSVFCDDNVNGTKDAGENRLVGPAWTVTIAGGSAGFTPRVVPVAPDGTFSTTGLPGGNYTATVLYNAGTNWPTNPEIVTPLGPTTQNFTISAAQLTPPDLAFPFSCIRRGDICVKVYCDEDCDGIRDAGEPAYAGAKIELKDALGNVVPPAWISTISPDEFCWTGLPPGTYTLNLDGTSLAADVEPSTPTTVTLNLNQGGVARGEFGICKLGKICGIAFEEKVGDWDKKYQPGETLLAGVQVQLSGNGLVAPFPTTTTGAAGTPNHGRFCFEKLKPGTYTVTVLLPTPASLGPITLTGPVAVNSTVVSGAPTPDVEFPFATAEVAGNIWNELDMTCDGSFDAGDLALAGIDVMLTGLTGDAVGTALTTQTNALGAYSFLRLKGGTYEVKVAATANNATLLKDLLACGPTLATPNVPICERTVVDFSYYPCIQDLKVTVFVDKSLPENCTYDSGTDLDLAGVTFTVHPQGDRSITLATGVTEANGSFTVNGLAAGTYWVCIDDSQAVLASLERCVTGDCVTVVLEPCKDECVEIGYKETCGKEPCCEGKLHEVVFKTHIWVGDCVDCVAVSAHLMETCDPCGGVSGEAWMDYCGEFPGPVTGYDGVVTIEDVEIENGIALVTIRLTATGDEFLRGYFDDGKHLLAVFVNGKSNEACVRLRCEDTLPGSMFPWSEACGPKADCDWTQAYADAAYDRWIKCECPATFIVCEQCSYEWWKRCVPCVSQPESKIVDLKFRRCKTDGDDHEFLVKLKWDGVVYDMIRFEFDGDSWSGSKTGKNGHVSVLKVYKDGKDWRAKVRIDYDCGCPEGALPSCVFLWSELDCCSLDKIVRLPCEDPKH